MHSLDFNARLRSLLQITAEQPCPTDNALHLQNRAPRALWIQNAMQLSLRSSLKPKGPGTNDRHLAERVLNVATSVPFVLLGMKTLRKDNHAGTNHQLLGLSLVSVGVAATSYHAASGSLRRTLRKLDYWSISICSTLLARALSPQSAFAGAVQIASLAMIPFQPTAVTAANTALMEVKFAHSSRRHPALRRAWQQHVLAGALGVACFALEDVAMRHKIGVVHAIWHCLACLSLAKVEPMLQNLPERETTLARKRPELCHMKL